MVQAEPNKAREVIFLEKICIIGMGYVGLPLALAFAKEGMRVIGFDINRKRIAELNNGIDCTNETSPEDLQGAGINFSCNEKDIAKADFVIVCVPTPIKKNKKPDLAPVESASKTIGKNLKQDAIVVFESTVWPGLTEEICVPLIERSSGKKCGKDFFVGYSPERINPGDKEHSIGRIVKVVSGMNPETTEKVAALYEKICKAGVFKAKDIRTAEAAKVIENIQRDLNIALMNELAMLFNKMGIDTKDVLDAAYTKWNFGRYKPGLVGGHCFDRNQIVIVKKENNIYFKKIGDLFAEHCRNEKKLKVQKALLALSTNTKALSFNLIAQKAQFQEITVLSKRKAPVIAIESFGRHNLLVTPNHPVVVFENKKLAIKNAIEIKEGDWLVLSRKIPSMTAKASIDVIGAIKQKMPSIIPKIRIRIKNRKMETFRKTINALLHGKKGNFFSWDYLPLSLFLQIEKNLSIPRKNVLLLTGKGSQSQNIIPAVIPINSDFARLLGYYLSEGCITKEKKTSRIRFTFNEKEKEYIEDVCGILKKLGIKHSIWKDHGRKSCHIKISSYILSLVFNETLECGTNCYEMKIPSQLFFSSKKLRLETLKGLLRGDDGVYLPSKKKTYCKNNTQYCHNSNSIEVSYFSSSESLFEQVKMILLENGIISKTEKRKGLLEIWGPSNIKKLKDFFLGEKDKKIKTYEKNRRKKINYGNFKVFRNFAIIKVKETSKRKTQEVFSLNVKDTETFITNNGLIAHNCISVDPYYLVQKAKSLGFDTKVILAGRNINDNMYKFAVGLAKKGLKKIGKDISGAKVLLLGLTFKENVRDTRETQAEKIIQALKKAGANVFACDPLLEKETIEKEFGVTAVQLEKIPAGFDCFIVVTAHDKFKEIKTSDLARQSSGKAVLVDTRNLFDKKEAEENGLVFFGF